LDRRTEILRRSAELFESQGVSNTSVEDIANAVGVKREAIYYYFKSRPDILLEVLMPSSRALLTGIRNINRTNMKSSEKLYEAFRNHLDSFTPGYLEMTVALREHHFFENNKKSKILQEQWTEYGDTWVDIIKQGQENGEFNNGLNAKIIAFGLLGMCNWMSRWYDPSGEVTIDEIIENYFTMTSTGIAAGPTDLEAVLPGFRAEGTAAE